MNQNNFEAIALLDNLTRNNFDALGGFVTKRAFEYLKGIKKKDLRSSVDAVNFWFQMDMNLKIREVNEKLDRS